jgi:hypothetical protein
MSPSSSRHLGAGAVGGGMHEGVVKSTVVAGGIRRPEVIRPVAKSPHTMLQMSSGGV